MFRAISTPAFSIAAAAGILASGALAALAWRAPRVAIGAAIGVACALVPNEIVGCTRALAEPLASTNPDGGLLMDSAPFFVVASLVAGGVLASLLCGTLADALVRRMPHVFVALAVGATAVSGVVAARGLASMSRPEPDDFAHVLDEIAPIQPGQRIVVGGTTFDYRADARAASYLPGEEMCILHTSDGAGPREAGMTSIDRRCPSLQVFRDRRTGAGVVVPVEGRLTVARPLTVFGTSGRPVLRVDDLGGELGAPRAWTFGTSVGFVFAAAGLLAAIVTLRRRRAYDAAVETLHSGDGWISLGDAKRHVASLEGAAPGRVVVLEAPRGHHAAYRDDGSPHAISARPGTKAGLRDEIATRALAWSCVAIATVAITVTPLWVARVSGLL